VLEAPAVVASLDDIAMVSDAVEQRSGHLGITERFMMLLSLMG
jgi:hypothetical protein